MTEDMTIRERLMSALEFALGEAKKGVERAPVYHPDFTEKMRWFQFMDSLWTDFNDYILVHKSHLNVRCEPDEVFRQHLVQTGLCVVIDSWVGQDEIDLAYGRVDVLAHEKEKQMRNLLRGLEVPKGR
jgi:hypothetical protein